MKDTGRSPDKDAMTGTTTPETAALPAAAPPVRPAAAGALTTDIQHRIGTQLQSLYNDLLTEATPDRFLKLLDDLDRKT